MANQSNRWQFFRVVVQVADDDGRHRLSFILMCELFVKTVLWHPRRDSLGLSGKSLLRKIMSLRKHNQNKSRLRLQ
jgi:hypothetical protein